MLSYKKIQHSWKISDNSKVYPNEESMRDSRTLLPERFSPLKSNSKESHAFHASKEKLNLIKNKSSQPQVLTPRSRDNNPLFSSNYLTDSVQLPEGPNKGLPIHPNLASKESLILKNLESETPKKAAKAPSADSKLLKQANDINWQAINKIKNEFCSFRTQIWAELMQQREMITKIALEIGKQIQAMRKSEDRRVEESAFIGISSVDLSPRLESINQQINNFTKTITKFQQTEQVTEEHLAPVEIQPFQHIETPIAKLEEISKIPQKRSSPLDKCTQIAETIGILNEINSSPVKHSKARSIEKQSVQQYKQKLLAICRSNQQLIKQPSRPAPSPSDSQLKLKGNFKLDKFYSAIQKLKSEVNEIRNINQMKQLKKLKIVQVKE